MEREEGRGEREERKEEKRQGVGAIGQAV